jgi:hypothetical protein
VPLRVGDTFFMSGTGGMANPNGAHLMVCLTVDREKDVAVVVPIVTRHDRSDTSCVLNVGDHNFITRESCASYDFARAISWSETSREIDQRKIRLRDPVSAEVIKRLQVGFVLSDETKSDPGQASSGYSTSLK